MLAENASATQPSAAVDPEPPSDAGSVEAIAKPPPSLDLSYADAASLAACVPLRTVPRTVRRDLLRAKGKLDVRASYVALFSDDAAVNEKANGFIENDLRRRQTAFVSLANELLEGTPESGPGTGATDDIRCDALVVRRGLFTVACHEYTYIAGTAHPNINHFGYNVALCSRMDAQPVFLRSICTSEAVCRKRIGDMLAEILTRALADAGDEVPVFFDEDAEKIYRLEFPTFVITRTGLRFFVELPHVIADLGTINVPFSRLADLLRHEGPLAGMF